MYSDNQGALALTKGEGHHSRSKHIDIRHHFIREQTSIASESNIADVLTKPLEKIRHCSAIRMLGMCVID